MDDTSHFICIRGNATKVEPLCSIRWAPSYQASLAPQVTELVHLSVLFILKLPSTAISTINHIAQLGNNHASTVKLDSCDDDLDPEHNGIAIALLYETSLERRHLIFHQDNT